MTTHKKLPKTTQIWRLRVPLELVQKIKQIAVLEQRSTTKQAAVMLDEAIAWREHTQARISGERAALEIYGKTVEIE